MCFGTNIKNRYAWNTNQEGKCEDAKILTDIYYATTAVNIATDWFCAAMYVSLKIVVASFATHGHG